MSKREEKELPEDVFFHEGLVTMCDGGKISSSVLVRDSKKVEYSLCSNCHGSGRTTRFTFLKRKCTICNGSGKVLF